MLAVVMSVGVGYQMSAQARTSSLPDFTTIVEKSEAAVVNIRTTAKVSGNRQVHVDVVLSLKSAAYRAVWVPASLSRPMDTC
jgi:S1-C subfamily serine protease